MDIGFLDHSKFIIRTRLTNNPIYAGVLDNKDEIIELLKKNIQQLTNKEKEDLKIAINKLKSNIPNLFINQFGWGQIAADNEVDYCDAILQALQAAARGGGRRKMRRSSRRITRQKHSGKRR